MYVQVEYSLVFQVIISWHSCVTAWLKGGHRFQQQSSRTNVHSVVWNGTDMCRGSCINEWKAWRDARDFLQLPNVRQSHVRKKRSSASKSSRWKKNTQLPVGRVPSSVCVCERERDFTLFISVFYFSWRAPSSHLKHLYRGLLHYYPAFINFLQ